MNTILHLSDLHFGEPDTPTMIFSEINNLKKKILEMEVKIDYIFMTGDMVMYDSLSTSYSLLSLFIEDIAKTFNVHKNNIFYVTGNHENIREFNNCEKNWILYKNFVKKYCNELCLNLDYNFNIDGFSFYFYNTLVNVYNNNVQIKKNFNNKDNCEKMIFVQHADEKYYNDLSNDKKVICGHKVGEHIDYENVGISDNFKLVVGSLDGFCSGHYMVGVYILDNTNDKIKTRFITC